MTALVVIEAVVIALLVVLVAGLLRSHAEILRRLHALDGGEASGGRTTRIQISSRGPVPSHVGGRTPGGDSISVATGGSRGMVLLAFLSSGCTTCRPFWSELGAGAPMPADDVRPLIITKGPDEESPSAIRELAPAGVTTIMSSEAWDDFRIPVSPYFVLVDAAAGAVLGEGAAGSWAHVHDLLAQSLADAHGGRGTGARARQAGEELSSAGIEPGDPSLYRDPGGRG